MYCTYRWNGSQHAVKPDVGSESRLLPSPPAFDATVTGVVVGILPCRLVWKNQNGLATDGEKIEDTFIRFGTIHERDGHTQTPHDGIGRAYA